MRHRIPAFLSSAAAAITVAGSLLTVSPAAAQAPQLPAGTYQQSCKDASVVDGNLVALCQTSDGQYRLTTLTNPQNCQGDIANSNGKLQCLTVKPLDQSVPPGDYQRSCKNWAMADGALLAMCQTSDGQYRATTLANAASCKGSIVNSNGKLECRTKSSEFMEGWGKFGGMCGSGTNGTEFLTVRLGGRRDAELKMVFDEPYKQGVLYIYLPKGSSSAARCGSYPDGNAQFTFKAFE
jgi:hypothetical protein